MTEMTYDPEADVAYIRLAEGRVVESADAGPFTYDLDAQGRVLGLEILAASKVLAPGLWQSAPLPARPADAAE